MELVAAPLISFNPRNIRAADSISFNRNSTTTNQEIQMRCPCLALIAVFLAGSVLKGQNPTDADRATIKQAALDYIEGWYEGNPERMERSLHPDLAKRIVVVDSKTGRSKLEQMSAMGLVQGTRTGYGRKTPVEQQQKDVTILDVFGKAASVKIVASQWIDYLHMAKFNGRWLIVNVLWEMKEENKK